MDRRRLFIFLACTFFPLAVWGQSVQLADSLLQKGKDYDNRGNMGQAEFYYREAYDLYRNFRDTTSWLEAGKEYASAMVYRSKHDQAMELYRMLLTIDHPANDTYNRGDLYNSMGWASSKSGKPTAALNYYNKSLPLAEESGDNELIGVVFDNIGSVYYRKGNFSKALEFSERALPYFKKLGSDLRISITLSNIGNIYKKLSLYNQALDYYNRSLRLSEEVGDVRRLSTVYSAIASAQTSLGNYDQALVAYQKSLEYSRQAGVPSLAAETLNNIGLLYKRLGEYDKARDYYRQSLSLKEKTGNPQSLATTTMNLGKVLWELGNTEEASDHYIKAFALRKQAGNPYKMAYSLKTMVEMELHNQDYGQAREYARQLKAIGDSTGNYAVLGNSAAYFGDISAAEGADQTALQHYRRAYAFSKFLPGREQLVSLQRLARQFHKLNSDSAVVYGQKAVNIIEQTRMKAGSTSDLKAGYFKKYSDFYTRLASWVLKYEQDRSRAFRLVEQAKARSFSDELAKASQNIDQQLPDAVRISRKERRNSIDSLFTRLELSDNQEEQARLSDEIRRAELEYAAYENKLASQYPELKKMELPGSIGLERAQTLVDEETAVLEYAIAGNKLITFLIGRDEVRIEQVSLPGTRPLGEELTTRVARFREMILSNAGRDELRAASDKLYNLLIKPFEESLGGYSNIIIVPDGALVYLPFEALLGDEGYLIEGFRIKYEPSLTSLTLLEKPKAVDRKELLAVAGSQSSGNAGGRPASANQLSALPSTLIEVDSIASHFRQVSILKEEQVSERAFKNLLQENRYRYVHLATHGIIDENRPGRSGLTLSAGGELTPSSTEDGMLRSSEIFGLDVRSDMVVLSACNTGLGKLVEGEGMLGMQRSFFYAGTATVIVSLWNVYDRSTASLMNEFYKALINSTAEEGWMNTVLRWVGWDRSIPFGRKATAMRRAKLKMINHPLYNHPVYWAPFIVVGR
ncbi:CHAT domain-containing protein [Fodinibius roseus]|uniref:CHAT domain-containing protein n=1 Tax=Fodinibius roseus TaxID=1194090 RepID=A0A1M5FRQ8_9BACT|nr:CHAT domain-containing tetratricopeptide repeat protein [Fodinibius roseus]SHF93841.1 CHAT domain-containing protein [Fodinibius roseus]